MRKFRWLSIGYLVVSLGLTACGGNSSDGDEAKPLQDTAATCFGTSLLEGASCFRFQERESVVYSPNGESKGIALLLHGAPGHPNKVMGIFDGQALANNESLVTVAPQGSGGMWGWKSLNDGNDNSNADAEYLKNLINELKAVHNVTSDNVYILGYSAGGFMGYKLACHIPEELTTVVALAGQYRGSFEHCPTAVPVAIHHFHSSSDTDVPMHGRSNGKIKSVVDTLSHWRNINGCDEQSEVNDSDGVIPASNGTTTQTWLECIKNVRFSSMDNVSHEADYQGEKLYEIYKVSL